VKIGRTKSIHCDAGVVDDKVYTIGMLGLEVLGKCLHTGLVGHVEGVEFDIR
jgi:hypothetical protein